MAILLVTTQAQKYPKEDLILCDCGTGDNKDHPSWSTSRQMNWYQDISWPAGAYDYPRPNTPDLSVEVPFNDGHYPWIPEGATARMPNDDVWTVYIEDGTPDGFKAGSAVTTKEGGQMLNCWAYRGRPISAAINKTVNHNAICWSAFVCNREDHPPPRPEDMGSQSATPTASSKPASSAFVTTPANATPTQGEPTPTNAPETGKLFVSAAVSPRFLNWNNTWTSFISHFAWDQTTGRCVSPPVRGKGYSINIDCAGIQIDADSHMTLLLIKALRDVGMNSTWFNQNPIVPGQNSGGHRTNQTSWVVMPEAFSLQAVGNSNEVIGYLKYNTTYDNFMTGPCAVCDKSRFNSEFFDPIIEAMKGTYPLYYSYNVQAQCHPWMTC
ncbi:hypothetical protein BGZ63DRAFT_357070 [Mariannaea sp. PMI_226]|nr:hypothetical protein BGZ63DRAFT_357070 [Mariannaea sp. PMI_226]